MRIGPLPDALNRAFAESRRTGSGVSRRQNALIRGFMTFQLARRTRIVMLTGPV